MLLSKLLENYIYDEEIQLISEKEFDTFSLVAHKLGVRQCVFLENEKYLNDIGENVVQIITTKEIAGALEENKKCGVCVVEEPKKLFFFLHNEVQENYVRKQQESEISSRAIISDKVDIAENNVVIEDDVIIEPYVTIYSNVVIKKGSIIRSGARIGGEGFEFMRDKNRKIISIKHHGGVIIERYVEIQANTCIDKGLFPWDDTIIGERTKIDNLVQIAHAVKIGKDVMIAAQSNIGGRTEIADNTWIGLSATVINGITIGRNTRVHMGSVVTKPVVDGEAVTGNFAIEHKKFIQNLKDRL